MTPNLDGFKAVAENMGIDLAKYDQSPYTNLAPAAELYLNRHGIKGDYSANEFADEMMDGDNDYFSELITVIITPERRALSEKYRNVVLASDGEVSGITMKLKNDEWDHAYEFIRLNEPEFNLPYSEFVVYSKYNGHRFSMELNNPVDHEWGIVVAALLDDELSNDQRSALEAAAFTDFQYAPDDDMQP